MSELIFDVYYIILLLLWYSTGTGTALAYSLASTRKRSTVAVLGTALAHAAAPAHS